MPLRSAAALALFGETDFESLDGLLVAVVAVGLKRRRDLKVALLVLYGLGAPGAFVHGLDAARDPGDLGPDLQLADRRVQFVDRTSNNTTRPSTA